MVDRIEYYAKRDLEELEETVEAIEVLIKAIKHLDHEMYSDKALVDSAESKLRVAKMHLVRPMMWVRGEAMMDPEDND